MKRVMLGVLTSVALVLLVGVAVAQMGWGPGMMMRPEMMGGQYGPCGGPGMMGGQAWNTPQTQVTEESAKELAQQYADQYLKGFTVDKVLPFTRMGGMTMYQAELKGPKDEVRTLHINPWGNVMPFGGPWRRG
jgi:hypothetical protein